MSIPSYPALWNAPVFTANAKYLVENGVKIPSLVKIGFIKDGEKGMMNKYIKHHRLEPCRGRAVVSICLKDKEMRAQLSTALNIYNRLSIAGAVAEGNLANVIVKAYKHFEVVFEADVNEVKLTLERFIISVTEAGYTDFVTTQCKDCGQRYVAGGGMNLERYDCCLCDWVPYPASKSRRPDKFFKTNLR